MLLPHTPCPGSPDLCSALFSATPVLLPCRCCPGRPSFLGLKVTIHLETLPAVSVPVSECESCPSSLMSLCCRSDRLAVISSCHSWLGALRPLRPLRPAFTCSLGTARLCSGLGPSSAGPGLQSRAGRTWAGQGRHLHLVQRGARKVSHVLTQVTVTPLL